MTRPQFTPRELGGYHAVVDGYPVGYVVEDADGWAFFRNQDHPRGSAVLVRVESSRDRAVLGGDQ